jgi:uncharacterized membrane protein YdjX (TVP38/TMEM64 family)
MVRSLLSLALAAGVAAAWLLTPLGDYANAKTLAAAAGWLKGSPHGTFIVLGTYLIAGLLFMPLTALVTATALVFPPLQAFVLATTGCLVSALTGFAVGHGLGAAPMRRLAGTSLDRLSRSAGRHGVLLVATLRLVPIAHFSVINLASGATHVRLRDFFIGTVIGCIPGIAAITAVGSQLRNFLNEPDIVGFAWLAGLAVLGLGGMHLLRRRVRRYSRDSSGDVDRNSAD